MTRSSFRTPILRSLNCDGSLGVALLVQEEPLAYDMQIYVDWITSMRQLVEDNVRFRDGALVDEVSNAKVAKILAALGA